MSDLAIAKASARHRFHRPRAKSALGTTVGRWLALAYQVGELLAFLLCKPNQISLFHCLLSQLVAKHDKTP